MKTCIRKVFFTSLILLYGPLFSQILDAPENLSAALLIKLSAFEKTVSTVGDIVVYVLGAPKVAAELEKGIGTSIGQSRLIRVLAGESLPAEKPNILFIGETSKLPQALSYSKDNKILSVTGKPDLVKAGVALGFGVGADGKPKVLLNLGSTLRDNLSWNPAIMKVARTVN